MGKTNSGITLQGKAITVRGETLKEGELFPSFKLVGNDMQDFTNSNIQGKVCVVSVVPSLDTPVCSVSTKRFNEDLTKLSADVMVLTVSRDLPFAQKRWCGAEGVNNVTTASDYKYRSFGEATGTLWSESELLARAVFVVDKSGRTTFVDYIPEIGQEPDYATVLEAVKRALA
jgi:thiol peroxidase